MKLKIIKKSVKEGSNYCIKSLFVSFQEEEIYDNIVNHLLSQGATKEQISKFCKPNEYNDNISYAFGLNCSNFTFDKVERFGVLDAKIVFGINEKGFINAKIQVENKKEQVLSYEAPKSNVDGWANGETADATNESQKDNKYNVNVGSSTNDISVNNETDGLDLPF